MRGVVLGQILGFEYMVMRLLNRGVLNFESLYRFCTLNTLKILSLILLSCGEGL